MWCLRCTVGREQSWARGKRQIGQFDLVIEVEKSSVSNKVSVATRIRTLVVDGVANTEEDEDGGEERLAEGVSRRRGGWRGDGWKSRVTSDLGGRLLVAKPGLSRAYALVCTSAHPLHTMRTQPETFPNPNASSIPPHIPSLMPRPKLSTHPEAFLPSK